MARDDGGPPGTTLMFLSPATAVATNEIGMRQWQHGLDLPVVVGVHLNFLFYAGIMLFARWRCLAKADDYLGRATEGRDGRA